MKLRRLLPAVLLVLAACDDPHAATAENLARALQADLPARPVCFRIGPLPLTERVWETRDSAGGTWRPTSHDERLDALVAVGLVRVGRDDVRLSHDLLREGERTYELTDVGRSVYRAGLPIAPGPNTGFCVGEPELGEVVDFSAPVDVGGQRVVEVRYTYRFRQLPDWVRHPALREAFPRKVDEAVRAQETEEEARVGLVQTADGWVVMRR